MNQEDFFQEAKRHPQLRQEFIDSVNLEGAKQFIKEVRYVGNSLILQGLLMAIVPSVEQSLGVRGLMSTVLIADLSFRVDNGLDSSSLISNLFHRDAHLYSPEFISTLVHHEGFHARELYEDPFKVLTLNNFLEKVKSAEWIQNYNRKKIAAEQRAVQNQLDNIKEGSCSFGFIENLEREKTRYKKMLKILK